MSKLIVHIGRSKSGSTTIQHVLKSQAGHLASQGVVSPTFSESAGSHSHLKQALRLGAAPEDPAIIAFKAFLAENAGKTVVLSSEFFFDLKTEAVTRLKDLAQDWEVQVVAYLRDYPAWLVSLYVQMTRKGLNERDFDSYFKANRRRKISALGPLKVWASVFGDNALRVRPLDRAALVGGDLVEDFLTVLGATADPDAKAEDVNLGRPWQMTEFRRALNHHLDAELRRKRNARALKPVMQAFAISVARQKGPEQPMPAYLTQAQRADLIALYNHDLEELGRMTGETLPLKALKQEPERVALPSLADVPRSALVMFAKRASRPAFWAALSPATQDAVTALLKSTKIPFEPRSEVEIAETAA